jgi:hypothetical protein
MTKDLYFEMYLTVQQNVSSWPSSVLMKTDLYIFIFSKKHFYVYHFLKISRANAFVSLLSLIKYL